jgi:solute carrier family 27 fatty acid transporter 1/4
MYHYPQVRGLEGRAGMAAIVDQDDTLNITGLADGVKKALPSYARPQFIRILRKVDLTGMYMYKIICSNAYV